MTDDVTSFWEALRKKWPSPIPPLHNIHLHDQLMLIEAINTILNILYKNSKGKQ